MRDKPEEIDDGLTRADVVKSAIITVWWAVTLVIGYIVLQELDEQDRVQTQCVRK